MLYVKLTTVLFLSAAGKLFLWLQDTHMCVVLLLRLAGLWTGHFAQKCSIPYVAVVRMLCSAGVANIGSCYFCIPLKLQHSQNPTSPLLLEFFFSPSKWNPYGMVCPSQCQDDGMRIGEARPSPTQSAACGKWDGRNCSMSKVETLDSRALVSEFPTQSHPTRQTLVLDPQFCYAWDRCT